MTIYARPGAEGSLMSFQPRYDNYIGGKWVAPVQGRYFENPTPVTGEVFCEVARSDEADVERALDAAHAAAPALAAGNAIVLKPAEQTPVSILYLMSLIGDLLPAGVLNVVNGFGVEAGKPLASSNRIGKIAFTGETTTGRLIMQYASQNLIPVTLELGGKSPNIFFNDVLAAHDDYQDKALERFTMFALNQGEVCTFPSRSLIQADVYDKFLELAAIRTKAVRQGDPLDTETMIGMQASNDQLEKVLSYIGIGKDEGARGITGGKRRELGGHLNGGFYMQPTILEGNNKMRVFQEEIFGPVVAVTS